MIKVLLRNGSNFLTKKQTSILSAAIIIMVMISLSRILGLVRNRVLAHFFAAETLSVYFAAFRLPEVLFEILIFGALSSAFIPIFTSYLSKKQKKEAWYVAATSFNFVILFFLALSLLFFIFVRPLYGLIAPGFAPEQIDLIAQLAKILLLSQAFFIFSYFLTGILESFRRFLVPAIAPLFYNLGIILGTWLGANKFGIYAPAFGAVIGAFFHFLIQVPLVLHLGFRPKLVLNFSHPGVKEMGRLAWPRVLELSFLQVGKTIELFLASLVSAAAYTYYTFANSLQLLPVSLFGLSIAKASLPTLSFQFAQKNLEEFKKTFINLFNEIIFLTIPFSIFLAVLRVPLVRLVFGAARFTWESTLQTGYALSAFCLSIFAQALVYFLTRSFWALHDSRTPVKISIATIFLNIGFGAFFILKLGWGIWSLALAFSLASVVQASLLFILLGKKIKGLMFSQILVVFSKITFSASIAGIIMFFLLKILDRSAWTKKVYFLGQFSFSLPEFLNQLTLDTRYTFNLFILTLVVSLVGGLVYLLLTRLLGVKEIAVFARLLTRFKKPTQISSPITTEAQ